MSKYSYNEKKYIKNQSEITQFLKDSGIEAELAGWEQVFSKQDLDYETFCGLKESFDHLRNCKMRTAVFTLGRTIEELLDSYMDNAINSGYKIGVTAKDIEECRNTFAFSLKIDFLKGEEIQLGRIYKRKVNGKKRTSKKVKLKIAALIKTATADSLHEIREYGRNIGAHRANKSDVKKVKEKIIPWFTLALNFIYDTQGEIIKMRKK